MATRGKNERYSQIPRVSDNEFNSSEKDVHLVLGVPESKQTYLTSMDVLAQHFINKMKTDGTLEAVFVLGEGLARNNEGKIIIDHDNLKTRYIEKTNLDVSWVSNGDIDNPALFVVESGVIKFRKETFIYMGRKQKSFPAGYVIGPASINNNSQFIVLTVAGDVFNFIIMGKSQNQPIEETIVTTTLGYTVSGTVYGYNYSRLGPYRINKTPTGTSASSSRGSAATTADSYWLTEQY